MAYSYRTLYPTKIESLHTTPTLQNSYSSFEREKVTDLKVTTYIPIGLANMQAIPKLAQAELKICTLDQETSQARAGVSLPDDVGYTPHPQNSEDFQEGWRCK